MNFQTLNRIEDHQFYLDVAFRYARERGMASKEKKFKDKAKKERFIEQVKIRAAEKSLSGRLEKILESFPKIDDLPEFYNQLIKATLDYESLKKSLGAVRWAVNKIKEFARAYEKKAVNGTSKQYYGRISSVLKQIRKNLSYLEEARKVMKGYPSVKTKLFTVALFGFPNVGKTTLLYKLTGSKPEINQYAFTTKNLNIGYIQGKKRIQVIDTPGTLDRFDKMNIMEKQAYLALKLVADMVVYIIDYTEPYPIEMQRKLLKRIRKEKPVLIYQSKADLVHVEDQSFLTSPLDLKKVILKKAEGFVRE
jgi:nucleolar GTP-binding protein